MGPPADVVASHSADCRVDSVIQNKRCLRETRSEIKVTTRYFLLGCFFLFSPPFREFLTVNLSLALHLSAHRILSPEDIQQQKQSGLTRNFFVHRSWHLNRARLMLKYKSFVTFSSKLVCRGN